MGLPEPVHQFPAFPDSRVKVQKTQISFYDRRLYAAASLPRAKSWASRSQSISSQSSSASPATVTWWVQRLGSGWIWRPTRSNGLTPGVSRKGRRL